MSGSGRTRLPSGKRARRPAPFAALATLLALLALLAFTAEDALAHGALRHSLPASGATLDSAPRLLRLTFSEPVELAVTAIELVAADGSPVALAPPRLAPDSAQVLVADVAGPLAAGRYTVRWRVVGRDGHPVRGEFHFTLRADAVGLGDQAPADRTAQRDTTPPAMGPAVAPAPGGEPERAALPRAAFDPESPLYAALRWASLLVFVPLLGVVAFRWLVLGPLGALEGGAHAELARRAEARAWAMGLALGGAGAVALLARLAAQGVATFGVSGVLDVGELFGLVRGTGWGTGWLLQAAGLALVVGGLAHARRSGGGMGWRAAAAGAGLIAIGMALSGHAAAAPMVGLALLSAAVHVLAASAWLGTLLVVLAAGIPALHRGPGGEGVRGTAALVRAFSGAAVVCAAVVVLTGVINASFELGTLGALWSSAYGRMLLLKLALLVPVALLGGYNRWRVVPVIEGAGGAARMQRTAAVELAFAALVLLATAVLVATPTPLE